MYGKNKVIKQCLREDDSLYVHSIFDTIQGEGPFAGVPAIFIRLSGCNLKCYWCDTDFERGAEDLLNVQEIIAAIQETESNAKLIVLTGGEPFIQNFVPLIEVLSLLTYTVQVETSGTLWLEDLDEMTEETWANFKIVCSPKTKKVHPKIETHCNDWKYIIEMGCNSQDDGLPITSTQVREKECIIYRSQSGVRYVQPLDDINQKDNQLAAVRISQKFGYRLCLQIHKIIGVE